MTGGGLESGVQVRGHPEGHQAKGWWKETEETVKVALQGKEWK